MQGKTPKGVMMKMTDPMGRERTSPTPTVASVHAFFVHTQ